ncbi:MAG: hypothetical protein M1820_002218 [Bogoriella megaspora]|nr:MAG: hypothetical protein M1820_002218 [Bogoriella megaspora]
MDTKHDAEDRTATGSEQNKVNYSVRKDLSKSSTDEIRETASSSTANAPQISQAIRRTWSNSLVANAGPLGSAPSHSQHPPYQTSNADHTKQSMLQRWMEEDMRAQPYNNIGEVPTTQSGTRDESSARSQMYAANSMAAQRGSKGTNERDKDKER